MGSTIIYSHRQERWRVKDHIKAVSSDGDKFCFIQFYVMFFDNNVIVILGV